MSETLDLKATLNLPHTAFPMKANLPQREPEWLAKWAAEDLYGEIRAARQGAPLFTLHDGPPYANGEIHLGHALNKILKDYIVKTKTMAGFNAPYLPGWDCHGLPIEINVDKELGARKAKMSAVEIRRECRKYAEKYVEIQRRQFVRLGIFGEWAAPYSTMDASYEALTAELFLKFLEQGYVYRGRKSISWCVYDKTALAEAEVEYGNHRSPSIYVKYRVSSDPAQLDPALAGRKVSVIIWTTTPWTLPASMAVAFHPGFEYVVRAGRERDGEAFLVESRRAEPVLHETGVEAPEVVARIPGRKLEGLELQHPFLDRRVPGVLADYVTAEEGTGAVHTAPAHGRDDYQTGVKYGLEIYCPVDESGVIAEGLPEYQGKKVFDANDAIIALLASRGALVGKAVAITHSYPHCWRCHNPIIFRASEQWFIGLDHDALRERALAAIKDVRWSPEWGEERLGNMLATRPDWNVSRQRVWGVPITVFHCQDCRKPLLDAAAARPAIELFRREGADAWYTHPVEALAAPGTKCPECGGARLRKEMDILDVWFDSGCSQAAVLGRRADLPWPADVYLEAGDQYRGWFHSSLLVALGAHAAGADGRRAPYRQVLTHGWTLDAQGVAMSKSLGNGVDPVEVVKTHGAEIVRLWVASVDFREDVVLSAEILARLAEAYRKFRNTFRYCLANLYDFDPSRDAVGGEQLEEIDAWALARTGETLGEVAKAYDEFAFHKAYRALYDLATVDLSAFYFDILKDRLYTAPPRSARRRSAQTSLYRIADALARALAPLLPFTAEEVWQHLPARRERSVHLAQFVRPESLAGDLAAELRDRLRNWPRLIALRHEVLKALEEARNQKLIGGALEARVLIEAAPDALGDGSGRALTGLLEEYAAQLPALFIVSQAGLASRVDGARDSALAGLRIKIEKAAGQKCARCWNYSEHVGEDRRYPEVCERCSAALGEIEESGAGSSSPVPVVRDVSQEG